MASFRASFERELRQRLNQKAASHQSEEAILLKSFKYFDLNNSGEVDQSEFIKVVEKIGIPIFNKQDFLDLFNYYDLNGDGSLDYKEFSAMIFGNSTAVTRKDSPQKASSMKRANDYFQGHTQQDSVARLQEKLRSRGATGILGIARQFKIFDDNNSRTLDLEEFKKAVKDFRIELNESEIQDVFDYFDRNRDNVINYDEFLLGIRGPMNQQRRRLAQQAFQILDKDGSGVVDINDIKGTYNGKMHPDVRSGKRTEESVLLEFISTFETYVGFRGIRDNQITQQEFEDYYTFISASIDRDDYFELMMNNAWRMNDGANKNWNKQGWASNTSAQKASNNPISGNAGQEQTLQSAYSAAKKDQLQSQQTPAKSVRKSNLPSGAQTPTQEESVKRSALNQVRQQQQQSEAPNARETLEKVRSRLAARGARGLIGIQRQFRVMDDNFDRAVNFGEFRKAMNDYKIGLTEAECLSVFELIDRNRNGIVEIDELVRALQGEMNAFRRRLVDAAFDKLDKNGDGTLTINDVKGVYNAKSHPDVRKGTRSEDEILGEFLETFELHHNLRVGMKDQRVSRQEFHEYYNNVSCNIDNDQYFEAMIVGGYRLNQANPQAYQSFAPQNYQNQQQGGSQEYRSRTTQNAPFGTSNIPTDYSTSLRPKTSQGGQNNNTAASQNVAAGNPSWPGYNWRPSTAHSQASNQSQAPSEHHSTYDQRSQRGAENDDLSERVKRAPRGGNNADNVSQTSSARNVQNLQQQQQQQAFDAQSQRSHQSRQSQASHVSHVSHQSRQSHVSHQSQQNGNGNGNAAKNSEQLFHIFRSKVVSRGTRGLQSLARLYRVADDDGSRFIELEEFQKICREIRVGLSPAEVTELFRLFDRDGSGTVDYDEFVRAVRGEMNQFRLNLVLTVFSKLDKNQNNLIEVDDVLGVFDASKHPEVVSFRKTEEEVLGDFLDTFEQHHAQQTGNSKNRNKQVTVDEFVEYYNNVSASIDDDRYFEGMIRAAWKI